jgi:broad specificity phosphatase PhoE
MAKIIMIRVCETVANLEGKISNYTPLTPNGIKQAERVRDRLKSYPICAIYSSEIESALKTAEIIAQPFKISVIKCPEFNETDLGKWDGMKKIEIANQYKKEWKEWLSNPTENWKFPEAKETLGDAQRRAIKKLKEIISSYKAEDIICIITHGNIIRLILCFLLNMDISNMLKFHQFNGSITSFEYIGDKVKIHSINDVCHLKGLEFADSITGKPWH